ncbi:MAG: aldehyde ferredoxin oxidoreductase family protein [Synergistaceae bacterium]|nr:aldehyde ferredoxin oxidoreductase family protein [Synergistaceae bacterium]
MFGKLLFVDLESGKFQDRFLTREAVARFLGGKGLGIALLDELAPSGCDPLDPENPLCFLTGPLTGTPFPTSGRFTVATRSPLTGLWLDSHSGGHFAQSLRRTGYDGIVFSGRADVPVYLWLQDGKAELREAAGFWGHGVDETVSGIRKETDPRAHVASIGQAGENRVRFASIAVDRDADPWRAGMAGRGGAGAVMGSKNLKAVAVKGTKPIPLADESGMKVLVKDLLGRVMNNPGVHSLRVLGTAALVEPMNRTGILPCFNFRRGYLENAHALNGANLRYHAKRDAGCFNCPIVCGRVMAVDGRDVKVEYEALALLGASCGVIDVVDVARSIAVCNDAGMDVISAGGVVAFAMDAASRDLLEEVPEFGDAAGQVRLLEAIARREGIGDLLAEGAWRAAMQLGMEAEDLAVHAKGMELPGYDPRSSWGMALAYATADRGGCHQRAWTVMPEIDGAVERFSAEGTARIVKNLQDERAAAYSLVVCDFLPMETEDALKGLEAAEGLEMDERGYLEVGERIWNLARQYNLRQAGSGGLADTLPPRILKEPLPMPPQGKTAVSLTPWDLQGMLDEYYVLRGWDAGGHPTASTLERLGIAGSPGESILKKREGM